MSAEIPEPIEAITVPALTDQRAETVGATVTSSVAEIDETSIDDTALRRPTINPVKPPEWDNRNIVPRIYK